MPPDRTTLRLLAVLPLLCLGAGCAEFPQLDRAVTPQGQAAPPPDLAPLDPLLRPASASRAGVADLEQASADLRARADTSRNRTDALARQATQDAEARAALEARRAALAGLRPQQP